MKLILLAIAAIPVAAALASCATPEKAAEQAEMQLIAQCKARGGNYEALTKSGMQTSPAFIIPTPFFIVGSTGSAQGYASGFCIGPNPASATACLEQGQYPDPFPANSGCSMTDDATRQNVLNFMKAGHAKCDPLGQAVGTVTVSGGMLQTVCLARQ